MNRATLHYYRHFRAHQMATWHRANNSGGGAWPGEHASAALRSAKAHLNFLERMKTYTKKRKTRCKN